MTVSFQTTLGAVLAAYFVMAAGPLARRLGWFPADEDRSLLKLVVNLLMPCLVASKILKSDAFTSNTSNLYLPPFLGFGIIFLGIVLSFLIVKLFPKKWTRIDTPVKAGTFAACAGMLNYGYVPIPLINELFPGDDRLLAVLFVMNLGTELALWTIVVATIRGNFDRSTLRSMLNIPTVVIFSSLALNMTGLDRWIPDIAMLPVKMLSTAAIPLSLLFVGETVFDQFRAYSLKNQLQEAFWISFLSILIRLVILPLLILLAAAYFPLSRELKIVMVIYAAMASAVFPTILTKLHHGDMNVALNTILSNSIVALVTTPIWIAFGLRILQL